MVESLELEILLTSFYRFSVLWEDSVSGDVLFAPLSVSAMPTGYRIVSAFLAVAAIAFPDSQSTLRASRR